jgi:hypothetical protein
MNSNTKQAPLFNAGELFNAKPIGAVLDENETISELRRRNAHLESERVALNRLHSRQEAEYKLMAKTLTEKNATILRQEEEIARLNRAAKANKSSGPASIPKDVWRRLLQLCHPDKHSNTDAATAATQWLNANKPV